MSKCPRCQKSGFRSELAEVSGYRFKVNLIGCVSCGSVVGVMPFYDPGIVANDMQKEVAALKSQIDQLSRAVGMLLDRPR